MRTKEYNVEIKETLSKVIKVKAASEKEALKKAEEEYYQADIVLTPDDYVDTGFDLVIEGKYESEYALVKGECSTVGELIKLLSKIPKSYKVCLSGVSDYGVLADLKNKAILIDTTEYINEVLDEQEEKSGRATIVV